MNFKKFNNITGWVICAIACSVYILTAEATGSLWDCGEFISSANKLQIPHPPGAPLFVLLGRLFVIAFGDNPATAAKAVNTMSALSSGFTILFLFWTITHFARRIVGLSANDTMNTTQAISILGSGVVGALAYTFSDSFWYSAVEGEVYALSSFFTAIVFWAILKWENAQDDFDKGLTTNNPDKWILFIFFMMGLSIGVHLLNLLCIPAIVMVYYLRKQHLFNYKAIRKWFIILTSVGGVLGMIGATIATSKEKEALAPVRDMYMQRANTEININDTTLSALIIMGTLVAIGLLFLIEAINKSKKNYYGGLYIFFVLGCVVTGVTQVAVIQYTVKAAGAFDRMFVNNFGLPFFSGFIFCFVAIAAGIWYGLRFAQKKGWEYLRLSLWCIAFVLIGYSTYVTTMIRSNADPAIDMYNVDNPNSLVGYLGREQYGDFPLLYGQKFTARPVTNMVTGEKFTKTKDKYESAGKDRKYVFLPEDKMAFPRMWDISNDQNHADYYAIVLNMQKYQDKRTGEEKYDDEEGTRPSQADNIKYFMSYQFYWMYFRYFMWNFSGKQNDVQGVFDGNVRDGNWITGIGFVDKMMRGEQSTLPDSLKNNKANNKLFALPFILGLIGIAFHAKRKGADALVNFLLFFFTGFAIVIYLNQPGFQPRERDYAYVGSFYAFAVWIGLGVMGVAALLSKVIKGSAAAGIAALLCFAAVPCLMAQQEWDDHDRSQKTLARDLAKNYLESCPKNAIVFSFGDNDTYPLWYAQEVEGIRPDVRVINYSLLGIDWYINQMRYKINESAPIDVIFTPEQISGGRRDYVKFKPNAAFNDNQSYNLYDVLKNYVGKDDMDKVEDNGDDEPYNTFPAHKFYVPVNKDIVSKDASLGKDVVIADTVKIEVMKNSLLKNELAMLSIIAANDWKRPICFTSYFREGVSFDGYLRREGLTYRLVPLQFNDPQMAAMGVYANVDGMKEVILNKFAFGNAQTKGVYFDEENRRHLNGIRSAMAEAATVLAAKERKDEAKAILDKADNMLLQENLPYGMPSRGNMHNNVSLNFLRACYLAGHTKLAEKVFSILNTEVKQEKAYYNSLEGFNAENMRSDKDECDRFEKRLLDVKAAYTAPQVIIPSGTKDTTKR